MEYREIHGYKYLYRVWDEGFVEMLGKRGEWKRLKQTKIYGTHGIVYAFRFAKTDGGRHMKRKKKTVWEAFRGPVPEGYQVNGRYSNADCSLENLFIAKRGLQDKDRYRRPVAMYDRDGNIVEVYKSVKEAAEKNYMSPLAVRRRCNRKIKDPFFWYEYDFRYDDRAYNIGNSKNKDVMKGEKYDSDR